MVTKTESILLLHTRNTPQTQRQILPQSKGWEKIFQSNGHQKQVDVAILISNKIDFKLKSVKRDGEGHFILITGKKILLESIKFRCATKYNRNSLNYFGDLQYTTDSIYMKPKIIHLYQTS